DNSLALRTPHWKYIEPSSSPAIVPWGTEIETGCQPAQQLYDMTKPYETNNEAANHPEDLARLYRILKYVRTGNYNLLPTNDMP
ncbi:MAG: arylsulfatase, partial [Muribaculaceae bacterium]|nr:arylsulfatase [Muribaculaceae bacterium]